MPTLNGLKARQVLDSRGRPTVEVDALASTGARGPGDRSVGSEHGPARSTRAARLERPALRRARACSQAVENVTRVIAPAIAGMDLDDQSAIDARLIELDGTPNKSRLGANALLGVSLAVAHAAAAARGEELFVHLNRLWRQRACDGAEPARLDRAGLADADGQHDLGRPARRRQPRHPGRLDHPGRREELQRGARDDGRALPRGRRRAGQARIRSALVGDEGGYGPRLRDNEQAFEIVVEAIRACGFEPGRDVAIAVDVASSHFFDPADGTYRLRTGGEHALDAAGMVDLLAGWVERYPIVSLEDGLAEDDWEGWTVLTERLGDSVQLIGDDLFATQIARLQVGNRAPARPMRS